LDYSSFGQLILQALPTQPIIILISIILTVLTGLAIVYSYDRTRTEKNQQLESASSNYSHVYDLSTLQSEFEQTLRNLSRNSFKIVFIIDELDKLDENTVLQIVEGLKSLLNQSKALFVLIADKALFDLLNQDKIERRKEYTLFSQKIFIQRPTFNEARKFLDSIVVMKEEKCPIIKLFNWDNSTFNGNLVDFLKSSDKDELMGLENTTINKNDKKIELTVNLPADQIKQTIGFERSEWQVSDKVVSLKYSEEKDPIDIGIMQQDVITDRDHNSDKNCIIYLRSHRFRMFQDYLIYSSRCDFFDLYSKIRDHLDFKSGNTLNIKLTEQQLILSKLQRIIELVYAKKEISYVSKWYVNDLLLSNMYRLVEMIMKFNDGDTRLLLQRDPFNIKFISYAGVLKNVFKLEV
jgi:hypothetical protein